MHETLDKSPKDSGDMSNVNVKKTVAKFHIAKN
jgi:hypothetical protein